MRPDSMDTLLIQERQESIQRQAEQIRLSRLSQVTQPGLAGRILMGVGGWMVRQGTRLQDRYEAASTQLKRPATENAEILFS
jgi:hypothetical protein